MTIDELKKLPKIELHCHLDGSLSREFIGTRLGRAVSVRELSVEEDCRSLAEYLEKFDLADMADDLEKRGIYAQTTEAAE